MFLAARRILDNCDISVLDGPTSQRREYLCDLRREARVVQSGEEVRKEVGHPETRADVDHSPGIVFPV